MRPIGTIKTGAKSLSDSQLGDFKKTIQKKKKLRDEVLYRIILFLGLRVQEAANIKLEHIDIREGSLFIWGIKNGRKRPYHFLDEESEEEPDIWKKLFKLAEQQTKAGAIYLFSSPKDIKKQISTEAIKGLFKRYARKAGLSSSFSIHSLRHSRGRQMAEKGYTAIQIMAWLRHRNVKSTQIYFEEARFEKDDRKMLKDFEAF